MPELCWKCRLQIGFDGQMEINRPYLHCHHEPKEKPICWHLRVVIPGGYKLIKEILIHQDIVLNNCPECGKKLGD